MELDSKIDGAAAEANKSWLSEASLYPVRPLANLEARLHAIFGADARYVAFEGAPAFVVTKEGVAHDSLASLARALVALRTRARFLTLTPLDPRGHLLAVEVVVYSANPHGPPPTRYVPFSWGLPLDDRREVTVGPNLACPCGAVHVLFEARRGLTSEPEIVLSIPCAKCGRSTLAVPTRKGASGEVHLKERLPEARIVWLPETPEALASGASDPYCVTQADFPDHFAKEARRAFRSQGTSGVDVRWFGVLVPVAMLLPCFATADSRHASYTAHYADPSLSGSPSSLAKTPSCAGDRACFAAALDRFRVAATSTQPDLARAALDARSALADEEPGSCAHVRADVERIESATLDSSLEAPLVLEQLGVTIASLQYCVTPQVPDLPAATPWGEEQNLSP